MSGANLSLARTGVLDTYFTHASTVAEVQAGMPQTISLTRPRPYQQIMHLGKQQFRIDFEGQRDLRLTESSKFTFTLKRNGDQIFDVNLVITLPDIWSPLYQPSTDTDNRWGEYDFRWIRDIGLQMIEEIEITTGSYTLSKYSGAYLRAKADRDMSAEQRAKLDRMTGNVPALNDPANAFGRSNVYPSAYYTTSAAGAEPSIRGRTLIVPIMPWFSTSTNVAFPLVSLANDVVRVNVTLRPISELFQVRDVFDASNNFPYVAPDMNAQQFAMYRFLQTPPAENLSAANYANQNLGWSADVHLLASYAMLTEIDRRDLARNPPRYLMPTVHEYTFDNVVGSQTLRVESSGVVTGWMWRMQRSDVDMRNEWYNCTNWPYINVPSNVQRAPAAPLTDAVSVGPLYQPDGTNTGIFITGDFAPENQREILLSAAIKWDGEYRETEQPAEYFEHVEAWRHSPGSGSDQPLYVYSYALNTGSADQPTGMANHSLVNRIELAVKTYVPPVVADNAQVTVTCGSDGTPIAYSKPSWMLYNYTYTVRLFEERLNFLTFKGGMAACEWAN